MDPRDLETIDSFLAMVGKSSLFDYLGEPQGTTADALDAAIKKRRAWAQGQQANPKFRNEALWVIKNTALVRKVLVDERDDYIREIGSRSRSQRLDRLNLFLEGVLAGGILTPEAEESVMKQGRELGLPDDAIAARLAKALVESGARRKKREEGSSNAVAFIDYYKVLEVSNTSTLEEIEASHKEKYRWARNLKDKEKATEQYAMLDEIWRILRDPVRRAAYDATWAAESGTKGAAEVIGYLPAPDQSIGRLPPPPPEPPPPPKPEPPRPRNPGDSSSPGLSLSGGSPPVRTPSALPPKPPESIGGRTLGLDGAKKARRTPKLGIGTPELVVLKLAGRPLTHSILVKNTGQGRMPGTVTSDREWAQVSPRQLDADAEEQSLTVTIDPAMAPRDKASALITISTEHGEKRAVSIRVERASNPMIFVGAGLAAVALLGGVAAALLLGGDDPPPPPAALNMTVQVDPWAGTLKLNGKVVGNDANRFELSEGLKAGEKVVLEAETPPGFAPAKAEVQVGSPGSEAVTLKLEMKPLQGAPDARLKKAGTMDAEALTKALSSRQAALDACGRGTMTLDLYSDASGSLMHAEVKEKTVDDAAQACAIRVLRSAALPLVGGDYGLAKDVKLELKGRP